MRRVTWILAIVMSAALLLAGCGKKDAGSVVKDLDHVIGKLESYQGTGRMVLQTGQEPQEYQVEVWYQQPHYYRISLTNEKKDITQVVLRNDDGVFVLTPHLHKSFRFQSDWPENQGQVYLFQSLAQSILLDTERQFTKEGNSFVFDVAANYANSGQMARQKIWLDQKSLAPQKVEVSDSSSNVLVKLDFTQFEFGKKLEKDSFDMQRNMTSWDLKSLDKDAPVSGAVKEPIAGAASPDGKAAAAGTAPSTAGAAGKDAAAGAPASGASAGATADGGKAPAASPDKAADGSAKAPAAAAGTAATGAAGADKNAAANSSAGFGLIEPSYMPKGVAQQDIRDVKLGENTGIMVRYQGTYNYTLLELAPQTQTVSVLPGDIVDLGYTLGVVTGDEKKTLTWTYEGIEFRLATADLPHDELVKIAQSVAEEAGK
ncbi:MULTISPECIES: outer membrane lipoprotein-sorting protein [unclassified Paenibacillus]|uniref:outer membrane lipoprotein-sorting protein n=1 Tax=unclassified Paenibacillus TaxID=185978 RepID=UPI00034E6527|nr:MULTISPECIES: outer membrane lipoprotein-sorting protein [unclassified Paenibacillus]EPD83871.1 hypothetical protein HMPREF1207_03235 [Paenibacillus sp. HGH0039]